MHQTPPADEDPSIGLDQLLAESRASIATEQVQSSDSDSSDSEDSDDSEDDESEEEVSKITPKVCA